MTTAEPRHALLLAVGLTSLVIAGCSGDGDNGSRVGIRLAWDQPASSVELVRLYQFAVYVDGDRETVFNVQCGAVASADGFPCTADAPSIPSGARTVELVAIEFGHESARSEPLRATLGSPTFPLAPSTSIPAFATASGADAAAVALPVCVGTATSDCYAVEDVATSSRLVTAPAVTPDGRLFFVDDGRDVRVVADQTPLPEPAFTAERPTDRIIGISVDANYARTGAVYLAWVEEQASDSRLLTIARYREVANRFGQGAVLISGLPVMGTMDPVMAVDAAHIYVALPTAPDWRTGGVDPYAGFLLRYDLDGGVPWQTGQNSPRWSSAYSRPAALVSDAGTERVFMSGITASGEGALGSLAWSAGGPEGSAVLESVLDAASARNNNDDAGVIAFALVADPMSRRSDLLLVDARGQLSRARTDENGVLGGRARVTFDRRRVTAVAAAPSGPIYVVLRSDDPAATTWTVAQLRPRN